MILGKSSFYVVSWGQEGRAIEVLTCKHRFDPVYCIHAEEEEYRTYDEPGEHAIVAIYQSPYPNESKANKSE